MKIATIRWMVFAFLPVVLLGAHCVQAEIIVEDHFDQPLNYDVSYLNGQQFSDGDYNPDDVSWADGSWQSAGGNPGGSYMVTHEHDVDRNEFGDPIGDNTWTIVQSSIVLDDSLFTYNPGTDGAISSITFSIDYQTVDPMSLISSEVIYEDEMGFRYGLSSGFEIVQADGNWNTYQVTLNESDFYGSLDFSKDQQLFFGFGFYSSTDVSFGSDTYSVLVDNFSVSVSAVPEPSSLLLVGISGFGLLARRRRG